MDDNRERLQKVMASCGVASRRKCEEIILAGRVKVNGVVVTELGTKVNKKDSILVDNKPLVKDTLVYFAVHKPQGYTTVIKEKTDGRNVIDLINVEDKSQNRLFPIGGLDYDASGIIILTNDGTLSYRLTKSAKEIEKKYQLRVDGIINQEQVNKLTRGFMLDGVMTKRCTVNIMSFDRVNKSSLIQITINEGRNKQVVKMCEGLGLQVKKLKRISFGGVDVEGLKVGEYRPLKPHEIKILYSL